MKKFLASSNLLRFIFIPILKKLNFQFRWRHDLTNRPFYLESYFHKGYWYYGVNREKEAIAFFKKYINYGDNVIEVGAHIGYLTQFFEELVGDKGCVIAIEPTPSSIQLLKKNINRKTKLIPKAASDTKGEVNFFTEGFGGFTNSLIEQFTQIKNRQHIESQKVNSKLSIIKVKTDTIDNICAQNKFKPIFMKIDAEGSEYNVLLGAKKNLKYIKALMVEITTDHEKIISLVEKIGLNKINIQENSSNYFFIRN